MVFTGSHLCENTVVVLYFHYSLVGSLTSSITSSFDSLHVRSNAAIFSLCLFDVTLFHCPKHPDVHTLDVACMNLDLPELSVNPFKHKNTGPGKSELFQSKKHCLCKADLR